MRTRYLMQAPKGEPIGKTSRKLLSDRPFCRFCASSTVLKWVERATNSLSEGTRKTVIGADGLIPERMRYFGQDSS